MYLKNFTVSWAECLVSLRGILPSAESLAVNAISEAMEREGYKPAWKSMSDWEDLDDVTIFHDAFGRDIIVRLEKGILIPDLCFWKKSLPFLVQGDFLEQFISEFLVQYRERFFNGDTVLLFPCVKTVCMFHHEGVYMKCKVRG
jgi:hypothetical protein